MPAAVDWELAAATARRLAGSGPQIGLADARSAVRELHDLAAAATEHVAAHTGLATAVPDGAVAVVDRGRWVQANVDGFAAVMDPLVERLRVRRGTDSASLATAIGGRVAGAEVGAALGFLGSRVLGQYELFTPPGRDPRLLLVAPNIVHVERELDVVPSDFRLWVCLHEETHRVQFAAAPWLGPWLRDQVSGFLDVLDADPAALTRRARQAGAAALGAVRGLDAVAVMQELMTPAERELMDRLTAVMSLLEGHADVVMDGVGPDVVPTVAVIRERFSRRRSDPAAGEALVRRLLGVESKLRQYRDGADFVRAVVAEVGMAGFNQVFSGPEMVPSRAELHAPGAWVTRVHGRSGV